jgi:carbonic anhydrase/acetyltransferase-like protein (isoleucine patch superfamily)
MPVTGAWQGNDMPCYALGDLVPRVDPTAFVHPDAVLIGDVRIGPESSVWPTAVLRGDGAPIIVGARTSVQDGTVIHCTQTLSTVIGDRCVVGHNAHLEGCTIHDDSLVGSGSVVLHRAQVGPNALVGAGALVGNGKVVPPFARALGVPATITPDVVSAGEFTAMADGYVARTVRYRAELRRLD